MYNKDRAQRTVRNLLMMATRDVLPNSDLLFVLDFTIKLQSHWNVAANFFNKVLGLSVEFELDDGHCLLLDETNHPINDSITRSNDLLNLYNGVYLTTSQLKRQSNSIHRRGRTFNVSFQHSSLHILLLSFFLVFLSAFLTPFCSNVKKWLSRIPHRGPETIISESFQKANC